LAHRNASLSTIRHARPCTKSLRSGENRSIEIGKDVQHTPPLPACGERCPSGTVPPCGTAPPRGSLPGGGGVLQCRLIPFLARRTRAPAPPSERRMTNGFDTIIVGGGAAGCVLANRLSASSGRS